MSRLAHYLLVVALALFPTAAAATAAVTEDPESRPPGNGTATATETPESTVIASDGPFAGFTLGAAVLAVLLAGTYRHLRG